MTDPQERQPLCQQEHSVVEQPSKQPLTITTLPEDAVAADDDPLPPVLMSPRVPRPGGASWQGASWVMLSDVVGTSVLSFAGVARDLGWVPSVTFIVLLGPVAVYTAVLLSRAGTLATSRRRGRPSTMATCAAALCSDPHTALRVERALYVLIYGFALLGQGSYLQTLAAALQKVVYDQHLCLYNAALIAGVFMLPFIVSIRRLSGFVTLCFCNLFLILVVCGICIVKISSVGKVADSHAFASDLTLLKFCGAAGNVAYAFAGHWMYLEIQADMAKPQDFPKVFLINAPLQMSLYVMVACVGYYYGGDAAKGNIVDNVPVGGMFRVANVLLFCHVLVAYVIKSCVVCRFLYSVIAPWLCRGGPPPAVDDPSLRSRGIFAAIGVAQLMWAFSVANAVPFFSDLLGLIGSLLSAPIGFIIPCVLYGVSRWRTGAPLSAYELAGSALVCAFAAVIIVAGTWQEIKDIIDKNGKYGPPFACHQWSADAS